MVKLNLGCGGQVVRTSEWVNIDLYVKDPDVKNADMKKLDFIDDNSVELIEIIHAAEHLGKLEYPVAFKEWYRVLKPGGLLHMTVPDLLWVAKQLIFSGGDLDANPGCRLRDCIYGGQAGGPGDFHYTGFTKTSMTKDLKVAGFSEVDVIEGFWHDEQLGLDVKARK